MFHVLRVVFVAVCLLVLLAMLLAWAALLQPLWGLAAAALVFLVARAGARRGGWWSGGTARFADEIDLAEAGMLEGRGLVLGEARRPPTIAEALRGLFAFPLKMSRAACLYLWLAVSREKMPIFLGRYQNILTIAPTGGGKGVSYSIPALFDHSWGSVVVFDPKGELFLKTAAYRRDVLGQKIVLLDPFGVTGADFDTFNPLDLIEAGPNAADDARALAEAMVTRTGNESDPHWNDQAGNMLSAFILFTLLALGGGERCLSSVRDLLTDPTAFKSVVVKMYKAGGVMKRMAGLLLSMEAKERAGVISTANRHSTFLDSPAIAAATQDSTFDPREMLAENVTFYLVLPSDQMEAQSRWLRLVLSSLIRLIGREGTGREILFLIDEAGQIGDLPALEQGLTLLRGKGAKFWLLYQSADQIKTAFEGKENVVYDNCDVRLFFGVNGYSTAEQVSLMLGETTICVESGSTNESRSWTEGGQNFEVNVSSNAGSSWSEQARKLLKPEEVLALDGMDVVAFVRGMPPILCRRVLYFQHPRYRGPGDAGWESWAWMLLGMAAVTFVWALLQ